MFYIKNELIKRGKNEWNLWSSKANILLFESQYFVHLSGQGLTKMNCDNGLPQPGWKLEFLKYPLLPWLIFFNLSVMS